MIFSRPNKRLGWRCALRQPNPSRVRNPLGFTLVELLVVVAIIGVLIGILLPAVQMVREAARRTACANNLHQIAIALQSYHSAFQEFPVGGTDLRFGNDTTRRQIAWSAFLLPYLEEKNVFDQLDLRTPFDSEANRIGAATILPVYICPSGTRGSQLVAGRGPADYGGIYGERINSPNDPPKGTMLYGNPISIFEIHDGTSNTIIVGEDTGFVDGQWINGRNLFDQAFPINHAPDFENDLRSDHPAGVNVAWCDGHVSFLSENTDLPIVAGICTRSGGESVND